MRVREIHPHFRGKGFTTKQMLHAPKNAVYVWCTGDLSYPKDLAKFLHREDLEIRGPSILGNGGLWLRGRNRDLVVDHACDPDHDEYQVIIEFQEYRKLRT